MINLNEIRNLDTGSEISVADFLDFVSEEMKLDMLSPELSRQLAVEISVLRGNAADQTFSFDGLCSLTRLYVGERGLADSLCAKLRAAEQADARGDSEAKALFLRAYMDQVAEEINKTLTRRRGMTLTTLAQTL